MTEGRQLPEDCFALPPGVDWMPVDEALNFLRSNLACAVGTETVSLWQADGRILADGVLARRAHPAASNSAVDGYAFAYSSLETAENCRVRLLEGRAAAGMPFDAKVPEGCAVRTLTGAVLPKGTDSIVLQESVLIEDGQIQFRRPRRKGINTRLAGEDIRAGDRLLSPGRKLRAGDIGHLAAAGIESVPVRQRLRVGVLSTGEELRAMNPDLGGQHVIDSNRPMLLALLRRWGYIPVDLGIAVDELTSTRRHLSDAAEGTDAILTSGGVSTGEEDHVSALLSEEASLHAWRIAVKPGRPLAMAVWQGTPVIGLPGNPVAAFVCALVFVLPALHLLSGEGWHLPSSYLVPAAFEKNKKAGRREYLRARLNGFGEAEVFGSEGSGLTSGLAWSQGLVELEDGPVNVRAADPVRFLPYSSFGL